MGLQTMNIGALGMLAQEKRMQQIGDNIANSSTVGFKRADVEFEQAMVQQIGGQTNNGLRLQQGTGVLTTGTNTDFVSGGVSDTGEPANIAILGEGFLPVSFNGQTMFTRAGDFSLVESTTAGSFVLMKSNGAELQGATTAGGATAGSVTIVGAPTSFSISSTGVVTAIGATSVTNGFIGLQRFLNPDALVRNRGQIFATTAAAVPIATNPPIPGSSGTGQLQQGALELSNVDLAEEFVNMIFTQRTFQANAKTITTSDEMLQITLGLKR